MQNILIISNSKKNKKEQLELDKYGFRIARNVWKLNIHEKLLKLLIAKLKKITTKNTSLIILKNGKEFFKIGKKEDFIISKHKQKITLQKISGKYHDIGKRSKIFQDIILDSKNNIQNYFIRHEYLSVLYIEYILLKERILKENDFYFYDYNLKTFLTYSKERLKNNRFTIIKENSIFFDLLFIIGTHHKLINIKDSIFSNENYIKRDKNFNIENIDLNFNNYELKKLKEDLLEIKDLRIYSYKELLNNRLLLLLADGNGSAHNIHLKNTQIEIESLYKKTKYKAKDMKNFQTLKEHSNIVTLYTKKMKPVIHSNIFSSWLEKKTDFIFEDTNLKRFKWQKKSIDFINNNFNKNLPTLTFLGSATGSGKTRFGLKLHNLIAHDNRLTVLNGLRSLTLQAGKAYKELGILEDNEINVIVGSKAIKNIYDSENEIEPISGFEKKYRNSELLNYFSKNYLTFNKESFLDTPLLVVTLDYIYNATKLNKASHTVPLLRLKTSDILIDEIDNLDINAQKALLNLIFLIGVYNKNLTISTATLYPEFAKAIYDTYEYGLSFSNIKNFNCFYLSDQENIKINKIKDLNLIGNKKEFKLKNNVTVKNVTLNNLLSTCLYLHENEHETYKDKSYSVGLIRIANIKNIKEVFLKLEKRIVDLDEDINIELVVYHSQLTIIERSFLEKKIDSFLNRKKEKLYEKNIFKSKKRKNVMIVIASPVEEVGRDHDFDWAIIEPSSLSSIIQISGRVFRHRDRDSNKINIIVMNKNFRLQTNQDIIYCKPGLENSNNKFIKDNNRDILSLISEENINFLQTNRDIYLTKGNYLGLFERKIIKDNLIFEKVSKDKSEIIKRFFTEDFILNLRENSKNITGYFDKNGDCFVFNKDYYIRIERVKFKKTNINNFFNSEEFIEYKNKFLKKNEDYMIYNSFTLPYYKETLSECKLCVWDKTLIEVDYE